MGAALAQRWRSADGPGPQRSRLVQREYRSAIKMSTVSIGRRRFFFASFTCTLSCRKGDEHVGGLSVSMPMITLWPRLSKAVLTCVRPELATLMLLHTGKMPRDWVGLRAYSPVSGSVTYLKKDVLTRRRVDPLDAQQPNSVRRPHHGHVGDCGVCVIRQRTLVCLC